MCKNNANNCSVVGDSYGGLTLTDDVAAVLESRSSGGWHETQINGKQWTLLVLDR
jgi:hypothetical protein